MTPHDASRLRKDGGSRSWWFVAAGLMVALALAFFVSPRASSQPDGLTKVAIDEGFADNESNHSLADSPTAGYGLEGVDDEGLGTGLAGIIGVTLTFVAMIGLVLLVKVGRAPTDGSAERGGSGQSAAAT